MKKLSPIAWLACCLFFLSPLQAQTSAEPSGVYGQLLLGVDPGQGTVTGYFEENYEPPNMPYLHCSFYLAGKKRGDKYPIQAWSPGDKKSKATSGELSFLSANPSKPSVLLKLEKLDRDCASIKPNLAKNQGLYFDLKKSGTWTEVRTVAQPKSPYYQAPDLSSPTRDSAKRGTVLTVTQRRSEWVQVQANQKSKGWIRETDLYPANPSVRAEPAPAVAEKSEPPSAEAPKSPALAKPTEIPLSSPSKSDPSLESKEALIDRLKQLDAQAFEMALQVLENPAMRSSLSAKRIEVEDNLNKTVSHLQKVAPSAYAEESKRIFETYLDLQYVEQPQSVVSLRVNQKIRGLGK